MVSNFNLRTSWLKLSKDGPKPSGSLTVKVLAEISLEELNPRIACPSKLTAKAPPRRSKTLRKPARKVLLFSPKIFFRNPFLKLGDHATATDGAKLFQS